MADDLEVLMHRAEGEGPSPEFRARLRALVIAELAAAESSVAEPTVIDIGVIADTAGDVGEIDIKTEMERPPPDNFRTKLRLVVGAIAAAVAVLVGVIIATDSSAEQVTTEKPPFSRADAELLTDEQSTVEAGAYLVDTVGTPFTLTLEQPHYVSVNDAGRILIYHPASQDFGDREIAFMRLTALADPAQLFVEPDDLDDGWPVADLSGWLDRVADEVVITNRQETVLGGLDATRVDLELGATDCAPNADFCALFGTNRLKHNVVLRPGSKYRIWVVDQGDEDPLVVVAAIDRASDLEWFDEAEGNLSTLVFGPVAPNPILETTIGSTELPFLGGIRVEFQQGFYALHDPGGFGRIPLSDWKAETTFLANPHDLADQTPETAEDLIAVLRSRGAEVSEAETTSIGGLEARTFDLAGGSSDRALTLGGAEARAWRIPTAARLWVIEHPDRGLLMVAAEASENVDIVLPLVVAQTETILDSVEFVELG